MVAIVRIRNLTSVRDANVGTDNFDVVSMEAELPEALFERMKDFLIVHPHWDQYQLVSCAIANFLYQNGSTDKIIAQYYLNGIFNKNVR